MRGGPRQCRELIDAAERLRRIARARHEAAEAIVQGNSMVIHGAASRRRILDWNQILSWV